MPKADVRSFEIPGPPNFDERGQLLFDEACRALLGIREAPTHDSRDADLRHRKAGRFWLAIDLLETWYPATDNMSWPVKAQEITRASGASAFVLTYR